ncbi:hypothetical protein LPJ73_003712 [Coemansia sp. RSA 2703]|nr:hypothetical protein LPJ73_003712 [Coemansia sp. RSA 2703]KAJ2375823.1 hypothetical protein IW150_002336 [Coemansia sp. RSA 2607]
MSGYNKDCDRGFFNRPHSPGQGFSGNGRGGGGYGHGPGHHYGQNSCHPPPPPPQNHHHNHQQNNSCYPNYAHSHCGQHPPQQPCGPSCYPAHNNRPTCGRHPPQQPCGPSCHPPPNNHCPPPHPHHHHGSSLRDKFRRH